MTELFSLEWMQSFAEQWNAEPELADAQAFTVISNVL
jgi:hypothetical protein